MARKAWQDLSPSYRARLERKGITAAQHADPDYSLKVARGHGPSTPSEMKRQAASDHRQRERIIRLAKSMGIDNSITTVGIKLYGLAFIDTLLAYREYRHEQWLQGIPVSQMMPYKEWFYTIYNEEPDPVYDVYLEDLPPDTPFFYYH